MSKFTREFPTEALAVLVKENKCIRLINALIDEYEKEVAALNTALCNLIPNGQVPLIARYTTLQNTRDAHLDTIANLKTLL